MGVIHSNEFAIRASFLRALPYYCLPAMDASSFWRCHSSLGDRKKTLLAIHWLGIALILAGIVFSDSSRAATPIDDVQNLTIGGTHVCALSSPSGNGEIRCWGGNTLGQLGDNTGGDGTPTHDRYTPVHTLTDDGGLAGLAGINVVAAGENHTCAINTAGDTWCWGNNSDYQAGSASGQPLPVATPMQIYSNSVPYPIKITAGKKHTCAVVFKTSVTNQVQCWGNNELGQLGTSEVPTSGCTLFNPCASVTPEDVLNSSGAAITSIPLETNSIASGDNHTCFKIISGTIFAKTIKVMCWGDNSSGQLGNSSPGTGFNNYALYVQIDGGTANNDLSNISALAAGGRQTCALTSSNGVLCWGDNSAGQLGHPGAVTGTTPVSVTTDNAGNNVLTNVTAIAVGGKHVCALTSQQQVKKVLCWGDNSLGQLGNSSATNSDHAIYVQQDGGSGGNDLTNVASIAAGGNQTCASLSTGEVFCWGANGSGQLGNGLHDASAVAPDYVPDYVIKATPSIALTSTADPDNLVYGQNVTLTAVVTGAANGAVPSGTVTFTDTITGQLLSCNGSTDTVLLGLVNTQPTATCVYVPATATTLTWNALYNGDDVDDSVSTVDSGVTIQAAPTSFSLNSPPASAALGSSVTFNFLLGVAWPNNGTPPGTAIPTGSVTIADSLNAQPPVPCTYDGTTGAGSCSVTLISGGTHTITLNYQPDSTNFLASNVTPSVTVAPVATTITSFTVTGNPVGLGLTLQATIGVDPQVPTEGITPSGNFTVRKGSTTLCTGSVTAGSGTNCAFTLNTQGAHTLTATYTDTSGNPSFSSSTTQTSITIDPVDVQISGFTATPAQVGLSTTISFSIVGEVSTGAVVPTGGYTVSLTNPFTLVCQGNLVNGTVSCPRVFNQTGTYNLTISYFGDGNFSPISNDTSHSVTIDRQNSLISIAQITQTSVQAGQTIPVNVTVGTDPLYAATNLAQGGVGVPTQTVTVTATGVNGAAMQCTVASLITNNDLSGSSSGSCSLSALTVDTYTLTATYNGDTDFKEATATYTASPLSVVAGPASSITAGALTSPTTPASVTVTITDSHSNPLAGLTVIFTVPTAGASAMLTSTTANPLGATGTQIAVTTDATGKAIVSMTSNGTAGSYNLNASLVSGAPTGADYVFSSSFDFLPLTWALSNP